MGSNTTPNIQRAYARRSHSQPPVSSAGDVTQPQQPKRKKRQDNKESTGRRPPKKMAIPQALKILAKNDLWGQRINNGFDPKPTPEAPPVASIIDFSDPGGQSYSMSMDDALCSKSLGPEDLGAKAKSKYISQARTPSTYMTTGVPAAPGANPGIFPDLLPFQSNSLPPNPPNFDDRLLYPGTSFTSVSHSPQPSEYSEVGSESISSADSHYAPSANGSLPDFGAPADEWTGGEAPVVYCDPHIPLEQMPLSQIGSAGPSTLNIQPFQDDWSTDYVITTSFPNPQAPAPFPFDHSNSVPLTTVFNYPTAGPYIVTNTMASQNFHSF